ncbi:putative PurR-regulated permease PerM [Bifidobacterium commune]|uniref:Predicted PurR-regulated permease PerM n=1 Tax=Bifidobacterium commune TaxID=1505727 RepID=A0A1C4H361_9BIFI|nr:AI-2E family transporter [Bifidobacterium commune]MBB2955090.1 putative PurR-regulated permease PerM [Bifidobacterium commune]SCC79429.1 Predicted PurR-regulated permease PerM [Bifidobacterium commune]
MKQRGQQDENNNSQKIDFASVFPQKGDSRRPPDWWGRALLYTAMAVFVCLFLYRSWGKVEFVVLDIIISIFIALAMEPLVVRLVRHGWKRGVASGVTLVGLIVLVLALMAMFGNMFVTQMFSMIKDIPELYDQARDLLKVHTDFNLPEISNLGTEIAKNIQTSWVTDFAGQAVSTTVGLFGALLNLLTIVMVTYYVSAAGPKMRRSLCQWLGPVAQRRFLLVWTVVQDQISGFLFSRTILAIFNAFFTSIFLMAIKVPNWLPLALFCGIVSQFVPTIGTYIGGALPVIFAWSSRGLVYAVAVVIFIVIYQQIENLIISPKVSQRTMDLNPAIAFLSVLVLGAVFGALGAFLALPITASLQAIFKVSTKRYDLVDSPLMSDPVPVSKSKVVAGAEAFNEHVVQPVAQHMPRAAKGSSARVPVDDELRSLRDAAYLSNFASNGEFTSSNLDESETQAIPKGALSDVGSERRHLMGSDEADAADAHTSESAEENPSNDVQGGAHGKVVGEKSHGETDNPRKGWR